MSFWDLSASSLVGPAVSMAGGLINSSNIQANNAAQIRQAEKNRQTQVDFAQHGIKWKVEDARAAGIHPLYALGAQTHSFSPVTLGTQADTGLGNSMASAGQDISRAINATRTAPEREAAVIKTFQDLQLQEMGLKNELLSAQIAKIKSGLNPPIPEIQLGTTGNELERDKYDKATPLLGNGVPLNIDKSWSDGQTFEDRWGEFGGGVAGLAVLAADLLRHARSQTTVSRVPPSEFSWLPRIQWSR